MAAKIVVKGESDGSITNPSSGSLAIFTDGSVVKTKNSAGTVTTLAAGGTVNSVSVTSTDTSLSVTGSPITSSGTINLSVNEGNLDLASIGGDLDLTTQVGTSVLSIANGGTGASTASTALNALLPTQTGNSGKVLSTDGTDTSWVAPGAVSPLTTKGDLYTFDTTNARLPVGADGQVLAADSAEATGLKWVSTPSGTVTAVSVASANGFAGSSSGGATPALTLTTSVTGILKGDGTALSAATSGSDYAPGTSGLSTGILKSTTTTGALSIAVAGDFPTLNQNTTGTASNVTGTVSIANGGTGQTTATAAFDALAPSQTSNSGKFLTTNGSTTSWATVSGGSAAGSSTQIQFNSSGSFGADNRFFVTFGTAGSTTSAVLNIGDQSGTNRFGRVQFPNSIRITGEDVAGANTLTLDSGPAIVSIGAGGITLSAGSAPINFASTHWVVNSTAGTSGQVLTSAGSGSTPTWSTPSAGTVTSVNATSANAAISITGGPITSSGSLTVTANTFTSSNVGVVPASGGGTSNYLRADGTWATPAGGGGSALDLVSYSFFGGV